MKISEMITDRYKLRIPPTVYYDLLADVVEAEDEQEPTTKNDLGVDCISKEQTIQRVLTYFDCIDKGCDDEWVKGYEAGEEDAISVIKSMPSVTPQEPRKGYLSIDDVMSVFDDFMCGEVDEDGTETFLEMLKDKAETEAE